MRASSRCKLLLPSCKIHLDPPYVLFCRAQIAVASPLFAISRKMDFGRRLLQRICNGTESFIASLMCVSLASELCSSFVKGKQFVRQQQGSAHDRTARATCMQLAFAHFRTWSSTIYFPFLKIEAVNKKTGRPCGAPRLPVAKGEGHRIGGAPPCSGQLAHGGAPLKI